MRIALGNISWRDVHAEHARALREFAVMVSRSKDDSLIDVSTSGDALVSRSRSIVASYFVRTNADVLLTIDSDILFNPEDALKLAREALRYDIIGGLYMTRAVETQPAMMLPNHPIDFQDGAQPVEVPYLSTGFVAVSRRVFSRLREGLPHCHRGWQSHGNDTSFWPFYMPMVIPDPTEENFYLSEDWAFCHRAKAAGFKCYVDPSIRLVHVGNYPYTLEDLLRPAKTSEDALRLTRSENGELETMPIHSHEIEREPQLV